MLTPSLQQISPTEAYNDLLPQPSDPRLFPDQISVSGGCWCLEIQDSGFNASLGGLRCELQLFGLVVPAGKIDSSEILGKGWTIVPKRGKRSGREDVEIRLTAKLCFEKHETDVGG
jgi:hypothetical protein